MPGLDIVALGIAANAAKTAEAVDEKATQAITKADAAQADAIDAKGKAEDALDKIRELPNGYHSLGEVESYSDLPASGNEIGDSYTVREADEDHKAGRYVWGTSKGQLVWYYLDGDNDYATQTELDEGLDGMIEVGESGQTQPSEKMRNGAIFFERL